MAQAEHVRTGSSAHESKTSHRAETDAEKRSNVETLGMQEEDYFNGGHPYYSGTKHLGSNIAMFVFCMLGLLATFWALGTYPDGGWFWFSAAIIFYAITFAIPTLILPSKTSYSATDGTNPTLQ